MLSIYLSRFLNSKQIKYKGNTQGKQNKNSDVSGRYKLCTCLNKEINMGIWLFKVNTGNKKTNA